MLTLLIRLFLANDMATWVCGYMTLQLYGYTVFGYMALWLYNIRFHIPTPDSHLLERAQHYCCTAAAAYVFKVHCYCRLEQTGICIINVHEGRISKHITFKF